MKQTKITLLKIFLLAFLFTGCSKDVYEGEGNLINKINVTTLDNLPQLKDLIENVKKSHRGTSREIDYLNEIDPAKVYIITDEQNLKTYTFGLKISEPDRLTNISIKETPTGLIIYNVKYSGESYEQWMNEIINIGISNISPDFEIKDMSKSDADCVETNVQMDCPYGVHHSMNDHCVAPFSDWTFTVVFTPVACDGGGGGGGTGAGSSGGGNTGPNGGGGAGTTPVITTPVPCALCPPQAEFAVNVPCDQLKEMTDNAQILQKINDLKPKTLLKQEFATTIKRGYNGFSGNHENSVASNSNGQAFSANAPVGGRTVANAHNHPFDGQSIPSWGDLHWIMECEDYINPAYAGQGLSANIVVVRDTEVATNDAIIYAVKIDDFTILQTKLNNDLANNPSIQAIPDENIRKEKMCDLFAPFFKNVQNNTTGLQKKFLEVFQIYGVSLYKFDQANNKWSKLSLLNPYNPFNPNAFNSVISKPCN